MIKPDYIVENVCFKQLMQSLKEEKKISLKISMYSPPKVYKGYTGTLNGIVYFAEGVLKFLVGKFCFILKSYQEGKYFTLKLIEVNA